MSLLAMAAEATVSAVATVAATPPPVDVGSVVTATLPAIVASALPSAATTSAPVTEVAAQVPATLEVSAAFAGALAGALVGVRLHFDLVGIATLAVAAGLGGGIIRDVLLQNYGVYALENPQMLIATLVAALVAFFFFSLAERLKWAIFFVDALALGIFAAIGSDKALIAGLAFIPAILLGTITAVGGGAVRDLLTNQVPQILRPGGFYATVAVAGSVLYVSLVDWLNVVKPVALVTTVVLILGLRLLTYWLGWQTPTATDLTPIVSVAPGKAIRTGGRALRWVKRTTRLDRSGGGDEWQNEDAPSDEAGSRE